VTTKRQPAERGSYAGTVPRVGSPYGPRYERDRRALLARGGACWLRLVCDGVPGTTADHDPPLSLHHHVEGSGCCVLRLACSPCQSRQALLLRRGRYETRRPPEPSRPW